MTKVSEHVQSRWQQALANDGVVSDDELKAIVSSLMVEIGHNPRDAMSAVAFLLNAQNAEVANVTTQGGLATPPARGVSAGVAKAHRTVVQHNQTQARELTQRVRGLATEAIDDLRERMRTIRIKGNEMRVDDADEKEILQVLQSTPEHLKPALAAAIRRDSGGLEATLSWALDGANHDSFKAFMRH